MKFQRISDWSRRHPVMAGSIGFLVVIILIFLAFDSYTRIRFYSEIRALERMGIPCDIEGFAERQRKRGNSREVFEEFLAHCRALSTENFPAPDASSPYRVLEPNDLSQFLADRAEEIQAADRFLEEHSGPVLWYDFESVPHLLYMDLPPLDSLIQYVRLNHDRFYYALSRNDPEEAARNFDRSAILRDYLLQEPYIIYYLMALSMEMSRQQTILDAAGNGDLEKFNSATLKRWGDSMVDVEAEFRRQLPSAMEENFAWLAEMIRRPGLIGHLITGAEAEVWRDVYACLFGTLVRLDGILILEIQEDLVSLAAGDCTPETAAKLQEIREMKKSPGGIVQRLSPFPILAQFLIPDAIPRVWRMYAHCRVVRTGLAVELFSRKYGRLPQKLDELVPEFLPAVPVCPFTGKPLQIESGTFDYTPAGSETVETCEGYRIVVDDTPSYSRTDRNGLNPVRNRAMKLPGGGEGKE
ncbi:hypothetical protein [uncultured Victivallis sp.]|uniref:hypothetical protein n=1 Tax=uncultured Victivallis sp. TaxID=354118 RepID=UPI0025CD50AE|nr:hypothetical protein [uncultured Victivallis sp.]